MACVAEKKERNYAMNGKGMKHLGIHIRQKADTHTQQSNNWKRQQMSLDKYKHTIHSQTHMLDVKLRVRQWVAIPIRGRQ